MLSSILKDHQARQKHRKEVCERKRKEAMESADKLTRTLVQSLNASVAQAYVNQRRIDAEAKSLQLKVNRFTQQTHQWLQIADQFNGALKELGDVENWSRSVERDMRIINDTLQSAYELHNRTANLKINNNNPSGKN
ncbi:biogenesis of lysosome-related organelles complex 1 subunit 1-like [Paramacrobiotus metropolitanus]|uniref:biogenesis of lysosome-related organelles complex 1 subunit 1-like n=1 Tax=Paramacrobiotus metropolitanus TaxID=2943436 RepID=UPI002446257A|nr:biogenesis of lysosome-related organelles complex 1 subunit 1-like [Paramacrobiotus metropolitanus]